MSLTANDMSTGQDGKKPTSKKVVPFDLFLQVRLEKLSESELKEFLEQHNLSYEGKVYGITKE